MRQIGATSFFILSSLCFMLSSCSSDSDAVSNLTNLTDQITGFQSASIDTVKTVVYDASTSEQYILSKGGLSTTGVFGVVLPTATSSSLYYIADQFKSASYSSSYYSYVFTANVTVSNSAAAVCILDLISYKDQTANGYLYKANDSIKNQYASGFVRSYYYYSSKAVTIQGSTTYALTQNSGSSKYTTNQVKHYELNLSKGWNEVAVTCNAYENTGTSLTSEYSYSSTIPSGMVWRWFSSARSAVKQKGLGLRSEEIPE